MRDPELTRRGFQVAIPATVLLSAAVVAALVDGVSVYAFVVGIVGGFLWGVAAMYFDPPFSR